MFKIAIPVLHITCARRAEDFYCERLGFQRAFAYQLDEKKSDPCYLGLLRDGVRLHVSSFSGDRVPRSVAAFVVADVDALHAEFRAKGVAIDLVPTDQTWGNREMYLRDPNGNQLRFIGAGLG